MIQKREINICIITYSLELLGDEIEMRAGRRIDTERVRQANTKVEDNFRVALMSIVLLPLVVTWSSCRHRWEEEEEEGGK